MQQRSRRKAILAIGCHRREASRSKSSPGNRLEALRGDRKGQFSIRVNEQYRVCFRWHRGDAYEVELVDYH